MPCTAHGRPRRGQFLYQLSFLLGKGCPRESSFTRASGFAQGLEGPSLWALQEGQGEAWRQKRCKEVRAATSAEQKLSPGVELSGQGTHLCCRFCEAQLCVCVCVCVCVHTCMGGGVWVLDELSGISEADLAKVGAAAVQPCQLSDVGTGVPARAFLLS